MSSDSSKVITMTYKQWNKLVDSKKIKDISSELPNSFLMYGQLMRAKILWNKRKYNVSAWSPGGQTIVVLRLSK